MLPPGAYAAEVKVYAAASLTDALSELAQAYQKSTPASSIKNSFASSATLAKQIENGANADVFISADKDWADYLEKRNLIDKSSRTNLLANQLVLIAPLNASPQVTLSKGVDLAKAFNGKLCTGDPTSVPVGKYAKQALDYFNSWKTIESRVVGTEDVRTALAFVERGECGLGIVYSTDAQISKKVHIVARFPSESHAPIIYPGALTTKANAEAKQFWHYLQTPAAAEVFKKYGFQIDAK
ncbi:MAG TPA: molybdate ABC transporter substrate-binding protein [Cellvibrionaceae bacterium]|nr:molybdate ABC transporter substrate-binding protein [Cellvibrionaceae bacterium]